MNLFAIGKHRCLILTLRGGADEVELLILWQTDPLLTSRLHRSCSFSSTAVFHPCPVPRSPVLVAHSRSTHPEPEALSTGVTQTHPHISSGGIINSCFHPVLNFLIVNRDQIHMILSAVSQSFSPRLLLINQDEWNLCRRVSTNT